MDATVQTRSLRHSRSSLHLSTFAARRLAVLPLALLCALLLSLLARTPAHAQAPLEAPVGSAPNLDGACTDPASGLLEYTDALHVTFTDVFSTTSDIYIKQTATDLWVCMDATPASGDVARTPGGALYLDPDNGQESLAEADDLRLRIDLGSDTLTAFKGDGAGGWTATAIPGWDGKGFVGPNNESAEWRVPLRLASPACGPFGMAVFHEDVRGAGDNFGWPAGAAGNSPKSWQQMTLKAPGCSSDLQILKTDSKDPVFVGEVFTYTLTITNAGPQAAAGVTVQDILPATLTFVSVTGPADATCGQAAGTVTCTWATLAAGQVRQVLIAVKATTPGFVSNTGTIQSGTPDPNKSNNSSTQRTNVLAAGGKIAYVFRRDTTAAANWKGFLESRGFTVQLIPLPTLLATPLAPFNLIMVAHDTGDLNEWPHGAAGASPEATYIRAAGKPVMGLGEGGYAYFGKHGSPIGWPNGWHGPLDRVQGINPGMSYWQVSTNFVPAFPGPFVLYTAPSNEVAIFHTPPTIAPFVVPLGVEPSAPDHASLILEKQECNQLWGFSDDPSHMTADGKNLAVNAVLYGIGSQCRSVEPPPVTCVTLVKSATPPAGTPVTINQVIAYKIELTVANDARCALVRAELEDMVPEWTIFVPGSAGPGIAPGVDGVVRWSLGPLAPGAVVSKSFRVVVTDAHCNNGRDVKNVARVATNLGVFSSNVVTHPLDCPPGVPAGTQPPYAEDEISIYPYPLVTGQPTDLSVRVRNLSTETITLRVTFESSPNAFGIGIPFGALPVAGNPRIITLPPAGAVGSIFEVRLDDWVPVTSGHYCIRVKIEFIPGPGQPSYPPIYTARNLDVMENLRPGVTDVLTFSVGNPTAAPADIVLVVENTCPGWVATVDPLVLEDVASGEVRQARLSVIPPTDRPLGTACHIDVQGWIGDLLIGGIRKLDVPPVNLPHANPPWEEREIVFNPDPPVQGQAGQVCIQLNNPMPFPRTVSVDFSWAAFGAGIPFTPISSLNNIVLPPVSFTQQCVPWTPPVLPGATGIHRCILVTLRQAGFQDQHSQRNVDIRRIRVVDLSALLTLKVPFQVGNPNPWPGPLDLQAILIGLNQAILEPKWLPDPPPNLQPGQVYQGQLGFVLGSAFGAQAGQPVSAADLEHILAANPYVHGDAYGVEVTALVDGDPVGGFSVDLAVPLPAAFLPVVDQ